MIDTAAHQTQHASCVAVHGAGVLILGASGTGKSALSLQLLALGAELVADDQTCLRVRGDTVWASAPLATKGLIEARGVGILRAAPSDSVEILVVVDMDRVETDRLPHAHGVEICGVRLPCLYQVEAPYFPAALMQYLKAGRRDP